MQKRRCLPVEKYLRTNEVNSYVIFNLLSSKPCIWSNIIANWCSYLIKVCIWYCYMVLLALGDAVSLPLDTPFQIGNFLVFGQFRIVHVKYSRYLLLSVICVVFLWSVSIDRANLNVLVVISKLLGQSIIGMRQLPRMNILVLNKDWLRHQNQ